MRWDVLWESDFKPGDEDPGAFQQAYYSKVLERGTSRTCARSASSKSPNGCRACFFPGTCASSGSGI